MAGWRGHKPDAAHARPAATLVVSTSIRAESDAAYSRLLGRFVAFYAEALFNPHRGELATLLPDNRLQIGMNFQGLNKSEATALWQPFLEWVTAQDDLGHDAAVDYRRPRALSIGMEPSLRRMRQA